MKRVSELILNIRDFVNNNNLYENHFESDKDGWNKLCVSMDLIEDSCLALSYFESSENSHSDGEKYLRLYGMLQGIILQQDAISALYKIFVKKTLKMNRESSWMIIRNLRNLTVGHPIEKTSGGQGTQRCFISRITLKDDGFQLIVWNKESRSDIYEDIDLKSLYESYKLDAVNHLKEIKQTLADSW